MESEKQTCKFKDNEAADTCVSHFILVPKRFAQRTREFLSTENRLLKGKGFMSIDTNETNDTLGIPISSGQPEQNHTDINDIPKEPRKITQDAILRERLALHLDVSVESIRIKHIYAEYQEKANGLTNRSNRESKIDYSRKGIHSNTFERLKAACLQIQMQWGLDDDTDCLLYTSDAADE